MNSSKVNLANVGRHGKHFASFSLAFLRARLFLLREREVLEHCLGASHTDTRTGYFCAKLDFSFGLSENYSAV